MTATAGPATRSSGLGPLARPRFGRRHGDTAGLLTRPTRPELRLSSGCAGRVAARWLHSDLSESLVRPESRRADAVANAGRVCRVRESPDQRAHTPGQAVR